MTAASLRLFMPGWAACLSCILFPAIVAAVEPTPTIRVSLQTDRTIVQAGRPVWVDFTVTNLLSAPQTLRVEDGLDEPDLDEATGLPVGHVFSGRGFTALTIEDKKGEVSGGNISYRPKHEVPAVTLAPHGAVGLSVDLTSYYDNLRRPGEYTLIWHPYQGRVASLPLRITILAERQAVMLTDFGKMTMRFYYDEAPNHVRNFIELVETRFYDMLTFHRVIPGGLIQGGDPRGDGFGVRPDGKRLKAEFSSIPFEYGTVGMARSPADPDSASSQFFICLSRQPSFDERQTAFGYLVYDASFETLRRIAAVPTGPKDRPTRPVYIRAISLENVPSREREAPGPAAANTQPAGPAGDGAVQPKPSSVGAAPVAQQQPDPLGLRAVHRRRSAASRPAGQDTGG